MSTTFSLHDRLTKISSSIIVGKFVGSIDPLVTAASKGDVNFLKQVFKEYEKDQGSYFLSRKESVVIGNFIHMAVKMNHYTFVSEALKILEPNVVLTLLCQTDKAEGSNPLHHAAKEGNIFIVKVLVNAYLLAATALNYQDTPPWLTKNSNGNTPVRSCFIKKIKKSHEYVARYLVSRDNDFQRTLKEKGANESTTVALDKTGAGILICAMREGFSLLAEQIITSDLPYSLNGSFGGNPLHHASKCNDKVCRLLLGKHPELIRKEPGLGTVLDRAVEDNAAWLVKLMLLEEKEDSNGYSPQPWTKACRRLIWHTNPKSSGETPLHIAARKGYVDIAKLLLQGYKSATRDEAEELDVAEAQSANNNLGVIPLHIKNHEEETPLLVALRNKRDDLGVYLLSAGTVFVTSQLDAKAKNAYQIAKDCSCEQSKNMMAERILPQDAEWLLHSLLNANNLHPSALKIIQHIIRNMIIS